MNEPSTLRHYLYNPLRQDPADLERLFVARRPLFERLLAEIIMQKSGSVPVHHLIIGQRGMGKTTMLARLALELRKKGQDFLPLSFWEEQHIEVDRLSVFWLNCLDSYADALDQAGEKSAALSLDARIQTIQATKSEDECARAARDALAEIVQQEKRRLVLFIDNFNLLLARLKEHDHVLRGFFTRHGAPIIIGAAITPPADLDDYAAAFYDGFKTTTLDRLSLDETKDMLLRLAQEYGQPEAAQNLWRHLPRLSALRDLSGGNPRTSLLIYRLCAQGFGKDVYKDLESLLDETTPLFQSRFEQLSEQGQKLVARLARHWYAATAEKITELTGFPRPTVSPLLGRLEEEGIVEKTPFYDTGERAEGPARKPGVSKKIGYRLSERFFNIWLIMRSASRRERAGIMCLARFLESIYTPEELADHARSLGGKSTLDWGEAVAARALAEVFMGEGEQHDLRIRSETTLLEYARRGSQELEGLIDPEAIDTKVYEHVELKERLKAVVPTTAKTNPEDFTNLVLGSISRLIPEGRARWVIANLPNAGKLNIDRLAEVFREESQDLVAHLGEQSCQWLQQRLQSGLWRDAKDEGEVERAIEAAPDGMSAAAIGGIVQSLLPELSARAYEKALTKDDSIFDAWMGLGVLHQKAGRNDAARHAYERALAIRDDWTPLSANYGLLLATKFGELAAAENYLRRASEANPRDEAIANNLAVCLWFQHEKNKAQEAITHFKRIDALRLNEPAPDPQPWLNIGNIYELELGDYPAAATAYRKAISMTSRNSEARVFLADLLLTRMGEVNEAQEQYQKACVADETVSAPWIGLGYLLSKWRRDFKGAEKAYRTGTKGDEPARSWTALAEMHMNYTNQLEEAEKAFREAIRIDPLNGFAWQGLGWLQAGYLSLPDDALMSFEKAVACSPQNAGFRSALGNIEFDGFNRLGAAERHFQKALELAPGEDMARHNLVFLLRDFRGDIAAAKTLFSSLRQPDQWQDTQALHQALFAAYDQNWGQAQDALRRGLTIIGEQGFPRNTQDDWFRASAVLLHLGFGRQLLEFLKAEGEDQRRMPWFEALKAHVLGDRQYLLNIPLEAQEVAGKIFDQIARRRGFLPQHTKRA